MNYRMILSCWATCCWSSGAFLLLPYTSSL